VYLRPFLLSLALDRREWLASCPCRFLSEEGTSGWCEIEWVWIFPKRENFLLLSTVWSISRQSNSWENVYRYHKSSFCVTFRVYCVPYLLQFSNFLDILRVRIFYICSSISWIARFWRLCMWLRKATINFVVSVCPSVRPSVCLSVCLSL